MVIAAEFEAGNLEHRQSVVTAFIHGKVEDRETGRFEPCRPSRLQPRQHLALRYCNLLERSCQFSHPRARRQDQMLRPVAALVGDDGYTFSPVRCPFDHALAGMNLRSRRLCRANMRHDGTLGSYEPSVGLVNRAMSSRQPIGGKTI